MIDHDAINMTQYGDNSYCDYWLEWFEPIVTDLASIVGDRRRKRYFWQSYVVFPACVFEAK